ncbi:cyanophycinase [Imperialibacter roseus]|uniref:Cyanophycinase n=1 Tax=Imperialibacter roseus TaxID=1324217 RepID=A0ABZ0IJ50_9BACT|nr:cyanophycinase [Imperialibacter roseus]WOK05057.1 cyanophycinase [Imperialibacter roseus]
MPEPPKEFSSFVAAKSASFHSTSRYVRLLEQKHRQPTVITHLYQRFPYTMKNTVNQTPLLVIVLAFLYGCASEPKTETVHEAPSAAVKSESKGPENGTLLIIGGAAQSIFYDKFMELVGGPDEPIVVIPTAASSDDFDEAYLEKFRKSYTDRGFTNVTVLHTRSAEEANTEEFAAPIKNARGVWFSGGRQWRHADSYLNTKTHEAFNELLGRGGVIAGSSAGATIQGSYLARGDTKSNTVMMGDHEEGLGFVTNIAIDQHLFARNRQFDLFEILEEKPELLGVGLDENTGIIVQGDQFTVFGESYVAIYDGTRWSAERDTIYQLAPGSKEFYLLKEGQMYDLKNRKVIN